MFSCGSHVFTQTLQPCFVILWEFLFEFLVFFLRKRKILISAVKHGGGGCFPRPTGGGMFLPIFIPILIFVSVCIYVDIDISVILSITVTIDVLILIYNLIDLSGRKCYFSGLK